MKLTDAQHENVYQAIVELLQAGEIHLVGGIERSPQGMNFVIAASNERAKVETFKLFVGAMGTKLDMRIRATNLAAGHVRVDVPGYRPVKKRKLFKRGI